MQKWEYAEVEITIGGPLSGISANIHIFKADGNHFQSSGKYGVLFAKLGLEGWELVAGSARIEAGFGSKHKINYVFKRPIL
jgi:hypothetical protein